MKIFNAEFIVSNSSIKKCPKHSLPEYAFIGRSNVGKSSLINMLCGKKSLAKISSAPGKTKLINHFLINKKWYLVDLPGYGYSHTSKLTRKQFKDFTTDYFINRQELTSTFLLIDARIKPQTIDINFIKWMGENLVPFNLVFTKCDKIKYNEIRSNINIYLDLLKKDWLELPNYFISSSRKLMGKKEILDYISKTNSEFQKLSTFK